MTKMVSRSLSISIITVLFVLTTLPAYAWAGVSGEWSDWGNWSSWSTSDVAASDSRQVETRQVAKSYDMEVYVCGNSAGVRSYLKSMQSGYTQRAHYKETWPADRVNSVQTVAQGSYWNGASNVAGNVVGPGTGYLDQNQVPFFIVKTNNETQYRYRDRSWVPATYKVTFTDGQGKVLETKTVQYGKAAIAPAEPTRGGYTFKGWDESFSNITGNLTVNATWEKIPQTVTTKVNISNAKVSGIVDTVYTGLAITQSPILTLNGKTLKEGTDYTVTYKNNVEVGTASISFNGKGGYTGTLSKTFKINSSSANTSGGSATNDGAGWVYSKSAGKWWYQTSKSKNTYHKSCWQKIDDKWYYFDTSGWMCTGWKKVSGKWYLLSSSGTAVTGWVKSGGKWYYLNPQTRAMCTGWKKVSSKWYYLDASGVMCTGWRKVASKWYLFGSSGAAITGWAKSGGKWYYLDPSSRAMCTGWKKVSGKQYYFNSSGCMCTGWKQISGKWYYFSSSGAMETNKWIGNYYIQADGTMAVSKWIGSYYVDASGKWVPGKKHIIPHEKELKVFLDSFSTMGGMYAPEYKSAKQWEEYQKSNQYLYYDCSKVVNSTARGSVLRELTADTMASVFFTISQTYPNYHWLRASYEGNTPDPLDKFHNWNYGKVESSIGPSPNSRYAYDVKDARDVDWIVCNIFNVSASDLGTLRSNLSLSYQDGYNYGSYYYNGKYYRNASSITGFNGKDIQVLSWRYEGGFYYVTWGCNWYSYRFDAKLKWKTIDGKGYWSLYTNKKL